MDVQEEIRLHVFLARSGLCSRRCAEGWISRGKVSVDGVVITQPGLKILPGRSIVEVDGKAVQSENLAAYFLLNKPKGIVSTARDERGRKTVLNLLPPSSGRVYPVGRLDVASEGLMLLTNDGELAYRLTHPKFDISKTYRIAIRGCLRAQDEERFRLGLGLGDGKTRGASLRRLRSHGNISEYEVILKEGRKRQIRRMIHALGCKVLCLCRTREGCLSLGSLKPGEWRHLRQDEIRALRHEAGLA